MDPYTLHHFCRLRNPRFQVPSKEPAAFKPTRQRFSACREFRVECTASERNHGTKAGGWGEIEKETEARGVVRALLRTDATPWCRRYASLIILVRVNQSRHATQPNDHSRLREIKRPTMSQTVRDESAPLALRRTNKREERQYFGFGRVVRITILYDRY